MATFTFSDDLPIEALKQVYAFVTAPTTTNKRDSLRAVLVGIDYGSQFVVGEPTAAASADPSAELKSILEPFVKAGDAQQKAGFSFNWQTLLALLLQILPLILKQA